MDKRPNSGELHQPAALESSSGEAQTRRKTPIPNIKEIICRHRTFACAFREVFEPIYPHIPRIAQGPTPEADRARFERIFRPWPKWVLLLGAELWHVDFPTIPRDVLFESFRVLHVWFFRCSTNPDDLRITDPSRDVFARVDSRVFALVLARFQGHATEHFEAYRKKLNDDLATGKISPEQYKEKTESATFRAHEVGMRTTVEQWSKDEEIVPHEMTEAFESARRKTFDKHGKRKETQLTPTYRLMLHNWIAIENMSGPKELATFLYPGFKGSAEEWDKTVSRTAAMCSRLRVKFRGRVK